MSSAKQKGQAVLAVPASNITAVIFDCLGVLYVEQRRSMYESELVRNDALLDFAESLHGRYKLGLLSNLNPGVVNKYFAQGEREKYFDDVVVSGDVGVAKPDPAIYELAAERLGVPPEHVLFIDDLASNCDGARAAGMQAILYENIEQVKADIAKVLHA